MRLEFAQGVVRELRPEDAASLARHANHREIAANLREGFPHPYTLADAEAFLAGLPHRPRERTLGLEIDGAIAGCLGLRLQEGPLRIAAEMGYWLGAAYWGRGIATAAVQAFLPAAIVEYGLTRVSACVYPWNAASVRVLEKAGFQFQCRLRRCILKNGQAVDQLLFAYVVE